MKNVLSGLMLALTTLCFSAPSQANLIMNLSDDGLGNTRMEFSGSATVASGFSSVNGIWLTTSDLSPTPILGSFGCTNILSGSATLASTAMFGGADQNVNDVCVGGGLLAPRANNLSGGVGEVLSWAGDLVVNFAFSNFIQGVYTTSVLQFGGVTLADSYILTIGDVAPPSGVPTPGALLLLGAGLLGFGLRRSRMA